MEVVPRVELRTVPHVPAFLAGLLGYRGTIIPVLELGLLLGVTSCQNCLSTRIILVNEPPGDHVQQDQGSDASRDAIEQAWANRKAGPNVLGLIAENVTDLTYAQPEQIIPCPLMSPSAPYLGALVQTNQGIVQLIMIEQLRAASHDLSQFGQVTALE